MKRLDDAVRIKHMLDAAKKAVKLINQKQREDFDGDDTLGLALTRLLEIIGEAANGLSAAFKEAHSHVAWKEIIGVRNHLIHGYFDVDYDIIWQILTVDIPELIVELQKLEKLS